MKSTATKCPVVLIHGVFGYSKTRPLWNSWSPYWPEEALRELNQNHLILDVGALSSDHDRACEAFYQLFGGRVDYGEDHSREAGHNRFGAIFGETTALELYQLICSDFFNVGSDHQWVVSLVSIAGPLTGSTVTHLFGLHELRMVPYSLGHFIGAALGVWFKLHTDWPVLRQVFDFRMPQWQCVTTFREILSPYGRINRSTDLAVFNILPHERMKRNARLIHMDKVFSVSVTTSTHVKMPRMIALTALVVVFTIAAAVGFIGGHTALTTLSVLCLLGMLPDLRRQVRALDYVSIPSLYALSLVMRRHVRTLHMIFDGFDRGLWGDNDGAVNLHSMLQPWATVIDKPFRACAESDTESTSSTSSSLSTLLETTELTAASATGTGSVDLRSAARFEAKDLDTNADINMPDLDPTDPANFSKLRRGHCTFTESKRTTWLGRTLTATHRHCSNGSFESWQTISKPHNLRTLQPLPYPPDGRKPENRIESPPRRSLAKGKKYLEVVKPKACLNAQKVFSNF